MPDRRAFQVRYFCELFFSSHTGTSSWKGTVHSAVTGQDIARPHINLMNMVRPGVRMKATEIVTVAACVEVMKTVFSIGFSKINRL